MFKISKDNIYFLVLAIILFSLLFQRQAIFEYFEDGVTTVETQVTEKPFVSTDIDYTKLLDIIKNNQPVANGKCSFGVLDNNLKDFDNALQSLQTNYCTSDGPVNKKVIGEVILNIVSGGLRRICQSVTGGSFINLSTTKDRLVKGLNNVISQYDKALELIDSPMQLKDRQALREALSAIKKSVDIFADIFTKHCLLNLSIDNTMTCTDVRVTNTKNTKCSHSEFYDENIRTLYAEKIGEHFCTIPLKLSCNMIMQVLGSIFTATSEMSYTDLDAKLTSIRAEEARQITETLRKKMSDFDSKMNAVDSKMNAVDTRNMNSTTKVTAQY